MDTSLLIGTWRVTGFTVRGNQTETPDGWAEFSFFDDGVVIYVVTHGEGYITDKIVRRWWVEKGQVNIHQEGRLAWNITYLTHNKMVLSQDNGAVIYTCTKINDERE